MLNIHAYAHNSERTLGGNIYIYIYIYIYFEDLQSLDKNLIYTRIM